MDQLRRFLEHVFAIGRLVAWARRLKEPCVMWNGWFVGVSKRGSDGRRLTDFYDVAIGDFDKALSAVRASIGKAREVHVWIKEPLQNRQILSRNLRRGEIRRRPNSRVLEPEHQRKEGDNHEDCQCRRLIG